MSFSVRGEKEERGLSFLACLFVLSRSMLSSLSLSIDASSFFPSFSFYSARTTRHSLCLVAVRPSDQHVAAEGHEVEGRARHLVFRVERRERRKREVRRRRCLSSLLCCSTDASPLSLSLARARLVLALSLPLFCKPPIGERGDQELGSRAGDSASRGSESESEA